MPASWATPTRGAWAGRSPCARHFPRASCGRWPEKRFRPPSLHAAAWHSVASPTGHGGAQRRA
eukprot:2443831-Alexandrium_andersonii.AAC.1